MTINKDGTCPDWDSKDVFDIENYNKCRNCNSRDCKFHNIEEFADWKLEILNVTWLGVGE